MKPEKEYPQSTRLHRHCRAFFDSAFHFYCQNNYAGSRNKRLCYSQNRSI